MAPTMRQRAHTTPVMALNTVYCNTLIMSFVITFYHHFSDWPWIPGQGRAGPRSRCRWCPHTWWHWGWWWPGWVPAGWCRGQSPRTSGGSRTARWTRASPGTYSMTLPDSKPNLSTNALCFTLSAVVTAVSVSLGNWVWQRRLSEHWSSSRNGLLTGTTDQKKYYKTKSNLNTENNEMRLRRLVKGKQIIYWQIQYRDDMAVQTGPWHNPQLTNSSYTRSGLSKICLKTREKYLQRHILTEPILNAKHELDK